MLNDNLSTLIKNFNLEGTSHEDIKYLKSQNIYNVIIKGLSETYLSQPINPIKHLALWMLNENKSNKIKERQFKDLKLKEELITIKKNEDEIKKQNLIKEEKILLENEQNKQSFVKSIQDSTDLEETLNSVCEGAKLNTLSTGVYIYYFDKKRKNIETLDNSSAHLTEEDVYRILHYNNNHSFLKDKFVSINEGVLNDLFISSNEDNKEEETNENNTSTKKENNKLNSILIEEVVRSEKIKFFKEPKLGCFYAVDISYKSSINNESLQSAISVYNTFKEEEANLLEEKNLKIEEFKQNYPDFEIENTEENKNQEDIKQNQSDTIKDESINIKKKDSNKINSKVDNYNEINNAQENNTADEEGSNAEKDPNQIYQSIIDEFESRKPEIKEFEKIEKRFVFAFDTLGQDRLYNNKEIDYIQKISKAIVNTRTEQEKERLLKMRDLRIDNISKDKKWNEEFTYEKLQELESNEYNNYYNAKQSDINNEISDANNSLNNNIDKNNLNSSNLNNVVNNSDTEKNEEDNKWFSTRFLLDYLLLKHETLNKLFNDFSNYEFVEFDILFQNILYFVGMDSIEKRQEINYENTNKLNWKKARSFWTNDILHKIISYNPYGSKQGINIKDNKILKINRLINVFESIDEEKLVEYSTVLKKLLDAIKKSMLL